MMSISKQPSKYLITLMKIKIISNNKMITKIINKIKSLNNKILTLNNKINNKENKINKIMGNQTKIKILKILINIIIMTKYKTQKHK